MTSGFRFSWAKYKSIDQYRYHFLESLADTSETDMEASGLTFSHAISDEKTIELIPGGSEIKLR